jgi:hypothetical protein
VGEPQELKEDIISLINNDGSNTNMNFGHERFEDAPKVPLFKGPTFVYLVCNYFNIKLLSNSWCI